MTVAEGFLRTVVESLDLCHLCHDRLLEQDRSIPEASHDFDIEYEESSVSKVRFAASTLQNVTVQNCKWTNVTFTNCKLSNLRFNNVELKNAHFYNIDFHHVTMKGVGLEDIRWVSEWLQHAFLTQASFDLRHESHKELWVPVLGHKSSSRTKGGFHCLDEPRRTVLDKLQTKAELRKIFTTAGRIFRFIDLPEHILRKIARLVIPATPVKIVDWPVGLEGSRPPRQSTYLLKGRADNVTYLGWRLGVKSRTYKGESSGRPHIGLNSAFILVNRKCYRAGIGRLYSRTFNFTTSIQSSLAFFHDHRRKEHQIKSFRIVYAKGSNPEAWHKFFNVLVHERPELVQVTMHIRKDFWYEAPWECHRNIRLTGDAQWATCVGAVLCWHGWTGWDGLGDEDRRNFLEHIARLPLNQSGHGVAVRIAIENSEKSEERKAFLRALNARIFEMRSDRPQMAKARHGHCKEKVLSRCCYWIKPRA